MKNLESEEIIKAEQRFKKSFELLSLCESKDKIPEKLKCLETPLPVFTCMRDFFEITIGF